MKVLTDYAMRFLGVPYRWGGDNPMTGFDCSGFVQWVLQSVGVDPKGDQNSQNLYDQLLVQGGLHVQIPQPGVVAFYGKGPKAITHVALYINGFQVIEAGGGGSTTTSVSEAAKIGACVRVRPEGHRKDRVALVMPNYPVWVSSNG